MEEKTQHEIYEMKLHDILKVAYFTIIRVPYGWVYEMPKGAVFVPMNKEFFISGLTSNRLKYSDSIPF